MTDIDPANLPVRYRLLRRGLQLLSYTLPPVASSVALDMFSTPTRRPAKSGKTKRILARSNETQLAYTDPDLPDWHDLSITVRTWGDPTHPRVLLAHGWEGQAGSFRDFIAPLTEAGFYVVAFDAPGHGTSTGERANLLVFMNTLRAVAAEHGPFYAIGGHSLGGLAALLTAVEEPHVPSQRIVLIAAPAGVTGAFEAFVRFWGIPGYVLQGMYRRIEDAVGRSVASFSTEHTAGQVQQDVLLVHDEDDAEVGFDNAQLTKRRLPAATLHRTSGLGHQLILRDNDTVAAVVDFLRAGHPDRDSP